eukprot:Rmarinus@m.27660
MASPPGLWAQFEVTKDSWRGKGTRVLGIDKDKLVIIDKSSYKADTGFEVTQSIPFQGEGAIQSAAPSDKDIHGFTISYVKTGGFLKKFSSKPKVESIQFATDYRASLLRFLLQARLAVGPVPDSGMEVQCRAQKLNRSGQTTDIQIRLRGGCLDQLRVGMSTEDGLLSSIYLENVTGVADLSSNSEAVVVFVGKTQRLHTFITSEKRNLKEAIVSNARKLLGYEIVNRGSMSQQEWQTLRLGTLGPEAQKAPIQEVHATKTTMRHGTAKRILCLTEVALIERDASTFVPVNIRSLYEVFRCVMDPEDPQRFMIQYKDAQTRTYSSVHRDALIANIEALALTPAVNNIDAEIAPCISARQLRIAPMSEAVSDEMGYIHTKTFGKVVGPDAAKDREKKGQSAALDPNTEKNIQVSSEVNVNVSLQGVPAREHLAGRMPAMVSGLVSLLSGNTSPHKPPKRLAMVELLRVTRRILHTPEGLPVFVETAGAIEALWKLMLGPDDQLHYYAARCLAAIVQPPVYSRAYHSDIALEQIAQYKEYVFTDEKKMQAMVQMLGKHALAGTGAAVVSALMCILTAALDDAHSSTTSDRVFHILLVEVAKLGRALFRLFDHKCKVVAKGAGALMKVIAEYATADIAADMQYAALAEGALLHHLYSALFCQEKEQQHRSRHLVALWTFESEHAKSLLQRMFPLGLLQYLEQSGSSPDEKTMQGLMETMADATRRPSATPPVQPGQPNAPGSNPTAAAPTPAPQSVPIQPAPAARTGRMSLLPGQLLSSSPSQGPAAAPAIPEMPAVPAYPPRVKRPPPTSPPNNWPHFLHHFYEDHDRSDLIWNQATRDELRAALEAENRMFTYEKDIAPKGQLLSWNHIVYEVEYETLRSELRVGDCYLRPLIDGGDKAMKILNPPDFFAELFYMLLWEESWELRVQLLQAMVTTYERHHAEIGAIHNIRHVITMLSNETHRAVRDWILRFLKVAIEVSEVNAKNFVRGGGVDVVTSLLKLVHMDKAVVTAPLQATNMLAAPQDMKEEEFPEFYYLDEQGQQAGPVTLDVMKERFTAGQLHRESSIWAQGMERWGPLHSHRQLHEALLCDGVATMTHTERGCVCLEILLVLCKLHPSKDRDGAAFRAIPKEKRVLSRPTTLPHICQVLLTNNPPLVERGCALLTALLDDNPIATPKLYLTGVFYFAACYTASNLIPWATFLREVHGKQKFREDDVPSLEVAQRSILHGIFPEAMVCFLDNHTPEKFCEIFLGNFDTPEAIWNHDMRLEMIQAVAIHLGDFPRKLKANIEGVYDFCPLPPIGYPLLEGELFCDIFYLRNLCDTARFPEWPVSEQVRLLQAIFRAWGRFLEDGDGPTMTEVEAYEVLGMTVAAGETPKDIDIRKAYRRIAGKYHPDKNPEGRDMFERIQAAYEFLSNKAHAASASSSINNAIPLLLRAQIILYERYGKELEPFKYAGYPYLLDVLKLDGSLREKQRLLVLAASLAFLTVRASPLNADELNREGGTTILATLLDHALEVVTVEGAADDDAAKIAADCLKSLAACARLEMSRGTLAMMLKKADEYGRAGRLAHNTCRGFPFHTTFPPLAHAAFAFVFNAAADATLQEHLFQAGVLWHLLPPLFHFDFSLEDSGITVDEDTHVQQLKNVHAKKAALALGRMGGYLPDHYPARDQVREEVSVVPLENERTGSPAHKQVQACLVALLTVGLVKKLGVPPINAFLKELNSNSETPTLIWDHDARAEVQGFIEDKLRALRSGETVDPNCASEFKFQCHAGEIQVAGVFLRVYNTMPHTKLDNANEFVEESVRFVTGKAAVAQGGDASASEQLALCLTALRHALVRHTGSEGTFARNPAQLTDVLGCLSDAHQPAVREAAMGVLGAVSVHNSCVKVIAESPALAWAVGSLYTLSQAIPTTLKVLHTLAGDSTLIDRLVSFGLVPLVISVFSDVKKPVEARAQAASVMCRLMTDRVHGSGLAILFGKFLPKGFLGMILDDVNQAVSAFDKDLETPEVIWTASMREELSSTVINMAYQYLRARYDQPDLTWSVPDNYQVPFKQLEGEVSIGGIYVRLFLKDPTFQLRSPQDFLVGLMDVFNREATSPNGDEKLLTTASVAVVALLKNNTQLDDQFGNLGYCKRMFSVVSQVPSGRKSEPIITAFLRILVHVARSKTCVEKLGQVDGMMRTLRTIMEPIPEYLLFPVESLHHMADRGVATVAAQLLQCNMVDFLVNLLTLTPDRVNEISSMKAHTVDALKSFATDPVHGAAIQKLLDANDTWKRYKDQRHDLFLTASADQYTNNLMLAAPPPAQGLLMDRASTYSDSPSNSGPPPTTSL